MVYSWQTVNLGNLAEQVCRPTDYFDLGVKVSVVPEEVRTMPGDGAIIFGGSGLLYPEIALVLEASAKNKHYPLVAWGIGHNTHGSDHIEYPEWLRKFDLIGLRDWDSPYEWVPCPSCMNAVFSKSYPAPKHPVVVYDQIDYPVGMEVDAPRENNCHFAEYLPKVIEFLASGETIITSSYHGAYWGKLLNRKVLVWTPWSTKFLAIKPPCVFVNKDDWRDKMQQPQDNSLFLTECRYTNIRFYERVRALVNPHL